MQQVIASFPGAYQLLPSPTWRSPIATALGCTTRSRGATDQVTAVAARRGARGSHAELAADGFDAGAMLYVAGSGHDTAAKLRVDGPGRFRFRVTRPR